MEGAGSEKREEGRGKGYGNGGEKGKKGSRGRASSVVSGMIGV